MLEGSNWTTSIQQDGGGSPTHHTLGFQDSRSALVFRADCLELGDGRTHETAERQWQGEGLWFGQYGKADE